ncbi:hypothetical protein [Streptomyces sp. NPDC017673]|uniref:hypothetical protein n=1 Tax=unclassified Streptomyces TaxID=2593676 RepID=UPI0037BAEEC1
MTEYAYDAAGRAVRLTAGGHEIAHTRDVTGHELSRHFGETLTLTSSWDEAGRITRQEFAFGDRTVSRRSYTYDGNGHLAGVDDTLRGPRRFALDTVGRVTAAVDRCCPSSRARYGHGRRDGQVDAVRRGAFHAQGLWPCWWTGSVIACAHAGSVPIRLCADIDNDR